MSWTLLPIPSHTKIGFSGRIVGEENAIKSQFILFFSSKSDEGALRNMTPKNTKYCVLTDFSHCAPGYTLAPLIIPN